MAHKKPHLPQKICPVCNHPFLWRKKWRQNWEEVKYCSKRCASKRTSISNSQ
ncbi:DUF2256 domain-containing protein [Pseudoalteromonas peptidolytica]|uniref:DUF2256 domain-containing protein n=1 Tax=Pseudoalteromonas peptidolytica TaxID=61150 RepID=UPI00298DC903|nr:DUF2256 domain-containing protein [Pseudoalteromonas peptidolytica]MDW7549163.1 DUF2256 domain-containing protein [Pseudoalteromonas peptidolytica]